MALGLLPGAKTSRLCNLSQSLGCLRLGFSICGWKGRATLMIE